jgi:hypothetical protein
MLTSAVTCCALGAETHDAVHDGNCPTIDRTGSRGYIDDQPHPTTGRVIRWFPGPYFGEADSHGHLWRSTRGPYAICGRESCRLPYPRWDGGPCSPLSSTVS